MQERPRNGQSLLHPARIIPHRLFFPSRQSYQLDPLLELGLVQGKVEKICIETQILDGGQVAVESGVVGEITHASTSLLRRPWAR